MEILRTVENASKHLYNLTYGEKKTITNRFNKLRIDTKDLVHEVHKNTVQDQWNKFMSARFHHF